MKITESFYIDDPESQYPAFFGIDDTGSMWICDRCGGMFFTDIVDIDDQNLFMMAIDDDYFVCSDCSKEEDTIGKS